MTISWLSSMKIWDTRTMALALAHLDITSRRLTYMVVASIQIRLRYLSPKKILDWLMSMIFRVHSHGPNTQARQPLTSLSLAAAAAAAAGMARQVLLMLGDLAEAQAVDYQFKLSMLPIYRPLFR